MTDTAVPNDRDAFIEAPAKYERRVVAFYDIMGWQSKITAAGNDVQKVTLLKNMVRLFSALRDNNIGMRVSTFSDNVVVSTEPSEPHKFTLLVRMGITQLGAAALGFFLRGGITIGDLVHDEHVVFGPALNRAYHLEHKVADKPRIVLDPECIAEFKYDGFVVTEDGVPFIDPCTLGLATVYKLMNRPSKTESNGPFSSAQEGPFSPAQECLIQILRSTTMELGEPLEDKNRQRLIWLQQRVLAQLRLQGLPPL